MIFVCMLSQFFEGFGFCEGQVKSVRLVDSTLYPGQKRIAYNVHYSSDNTKQEFEDEEIRSLLQVSALAERDSIINGILPAFDYLETRILGTCETSQYSCAHMYQVRGIGSFRSTLRR